jgi:ketosteroid isomerase-like protein
MNRKTNGEPFMRSHEKRALVERYIASYNAFDIEGMMRVIHPDIEFKNVSGGEITATASGADQFRQLAEQSKDLFISRKQTITGFEVNGDQASVKIAYEGVLACDLPNGMKAGEALSLNGRSEVTFRDGKIFRLRDIT